MKHLIHYVNKYEEIGETLFEALYMTAIGIGILFLAPMIILLT